MNLKKSFQPSALEGSSAPLSVKPNNVSGLSQAATDIDIPPISPRLFRTSIFNKNKTVAPLAIPMYRNFWIAGLFSNMGTWMHETGAQWLMNELHGAPALVAGVRTAMALPVFCLALPAGVWADRLDRRYWLLATQMTLLIIASVMALLDWWGAMTPVLLLSLTFCMGIAMILNQPAWQALTPELVPPALIPSAVAVGSVSFNLARSAGPALAGLWIATFGTWITFLFNAISFLGVIAVLLMWRPTHAPEPRTAQPFFKELWEGIVWLANSPTLRSVLGRVFLFAFPASCLWSLLSLVASDKLQLGASGFGILLCSIGTGAVLGTSMLAKIRRTCSSESTFFLFASLYALACACLAMPWTSTLTVAFIVLLFLGAAWMTAMTTLNATAQIYLPRRLRARGMAAYLMAFSCGMAGGSAFWGQVAQRYGLSVAFFTAAGTMIITSAISHRWPIGSLNTTDEKEGS